MSGFHWRSETKNLWYFQFLEKVHESKRFDVRFTHNQMLLHSSKCWVWRVKKHFYEQKDILWEFLEFYRQIWMLMRKNVDWQDVNSQFFLDFDWELLKRVTFATATKKEISVFWIRCVCVCLWHLFCIFNWLFDIVFSNRWKTKSFRTLCC
jgi:hypothetical protein